MKAPNALVPAGKAAARGILLRVILSIAAILAYGGINLLLRPAATVLAADQAGKQFENSDAAAVTSVWGMGLFSHLGIPFALLLLVLIAIWWGPARRALAALLMAGMLLLPHQAAAYYPESLTLRGTAASA
jgi:hypothetical protein